MAAPRFSQICSPHLKVETLVGVLDIVGDGFQDTFGEELLVSTDNDVSLSMSIKIFLKLGGINRLVGLSIETVPTQDVIASASDEDIPQQGRGGFSSRFSIWRKYVRRLGGSIGKSVGSSG